MARLRLQPGERELVRLRPGVGAFLPRWLGGLGLLAWAALVAWSPGMSGLADWQLVLLAAAVPALAGLALYLPRRRIVRLVLVLLAAAAVAAAPALLADWSARLACAALLAFDGALALALTELDRRWRTYHLTNLRVLYLGGLWERQRTAWTLHYDAVLDLDVRQTPLGRLFNHGTIEPVLEEPAPAPLAKPTKRRKAAVPAMQKVELPGARPRLWGVRPLPKVRRLVEAFVQDATATEYLRSEQQTQRRVGQAMQDLGRANLLR